MGSGQVPLAPEECSGSAPKSPCAVAVIICTWMAGRARATHQAPPELVAAAARACLQGWAQQVPGSFSGCAEGGVGLLLVPAYGAAHETAQALQALLDATARAAGVLEGSWRLRLIGPLRPGTPDEVQAQLLEAGWPLQLMSRQWMPNAPARRSEK